MKSTHAVFIFMLSWVFCQETGERITFTSANPFSFFDIITDLPDQESQEVYGILRFPQGVEHQDLPLVLGVAGSLGWSEHHYEYMSMYREMGIATFELRSFASRGVTSTGRGADIRYHGHDDSGCLPDSGGPGGRSSN